MRDEGGMRELIISMQLCVLINPELIHAALFMRACA